MRQRTNGYKFEDEFEATFGSITYLLRLHTLRTGYAGIVQPADFILLGRAVAYIELKETGDDAFSITQMQQLNEVKKFEEARKTKIKVPVGYYLIVHFIKRKTIKVITGPQILQLEQQKKRLHWNDKIGYNFSTLKELKEHFVLC